MASLFRSSAPKLSTPTPAPAPPATTSDGSPAKGVFDRYLAPSPSGSPSTTPRPPTEKRETQAQKKVRGLVERFELKAKSLVGTSPPPNGIKSSSSSKSLSAKAAEDGPLSPSGDEPAEVKRAEPTGQPTTGDVKPGAQAAATATTPSTTIPSSTTITTTTSTTPPSPPATRPTIDTSSPSASPRPPSPLLPPPESDQPIITSLTSLHLEPPSEASPSILSPIGETANPFATKMYDQIKSVAAVLAGNQDDDGKAANPRPPRQPSPEPEDERAVKVEVKEEEHEAEVPKEKEDVTKSAVSTPTTSQSQESASDSTATVPSSSSSEAAGPVATEVKKEEVETSIKKEDEEETAKDVKPEVDSSTAATTPAVKSEVKSEEDGPAQATLPLTHRHTLFFSDTSPNKKASGSSSAAYEHGLQPLFTSGTVNDFCGSWKALRTHLKTTTGNDDGLSGLKQDSNFHFFLEGIAPMWEDPMNKLGGRLTISLPTNLLDTCFTTLVLLLVGSIVEIDALPTAESHGGICGVVASRRSRGDRIEVWLGGPEEPDKAWVERVKGVLAKELGMDDILGGRYKKHFS